MKTNKMKRIAAFLFLAVITKSIFGQSKNYIDQPYVETTAHVDTLVIPDKIYMSIELNETDTKNKKSVEEMETRMIAKLKEIGINTTQDLSVDDLNSMFRKYIFKGQNVLKSKNYTLLVANADLAEKVFAGLESIDISNVGISKVEYSGKDELLQKLRSLAVKKAKENAVNLTKPLNQKVGIALYIADIDDFTGKSPGFGYGTQSKFAVGASSKIIYSNDAIELDFKKIKFECNVVVIFKME